MDLRLWDASQAGVEVQMLSSRQQLVYGVELRAVAHVLVDIQDVGQNSEVCGERRLTLHTHTAAICIVMSNTTMM